MLQPRLFLFKQIREASTKIKVKLHEEINSSLENELYKHRKHPGVVTPKSIIQPPWILNSIRLMLKDGIDIKKLCDDAKILQQHLSNRHPPPDENTIHSKINKVKGILHSKSKQENINITENRKAKILLKQHIYNWKSINYNKYNGLVYLIARSAQNYVVLYRIFNEISTYDKNFKPETLFDFGSGTGTVLWAASQLWGETLKEYFCVDTSAEMINLSEKLIDQAVPKIKPIFYRQFFPVSHDRKYDIVVSAYSLLELPSTETRLEAILKLWRKTNRYLVIIEEGSMAGFKMVNEARDFILSNIHSEAENNSPSAHVILPCPHDLNCPRYETDDTPCNFSVNYLTLPINDTSQIKKERYSFVVLAKGQRADDDEQWPRIVRPTLKRSRHVYCRMCTAKGKLEEVIITKAKHGRHLYRCARASEWGDRLPVKIESQMTEDHLIEEEEYPK